jgi:hypothetical protein
MAVVVVVVGPLLAAVEALAVEVMVLDLFLLLMV